jgi:hypothetical protein
MTRQTSQIHARYGRMYALVIMLAAIAVAGTVWAKSTSTNIPRAGMDVSAIMATIDMKNLPVHNITDNF